MDRLNSYINNLPISLSTKIDLKTPENYNQVIYDGEVSILQSDNSVTNAHITLSSNWYTSHAIDFEIEKGSTTIINAIKNIKELEFPKGAFIGSAIGITQQVESIKKGNISLKGIIKYPFVQHNSVEDKKVKKVLFHIFNLKKIFGDRTRPCEEDSTFNSNRLRFQVDDLLITIDYLNLTPNDWEVVKQHQFGLTYNGSIETTNGEEITREKSLEILLRFGQFISFLNGSYVFPRGIIGVNEKEEDVWTDYTNYITDNFKQVNSWSPMIFDSDIESLWKTFYKLTEDDYKAFELMIDWYLKSNVKKESTESSIITLQIFYELMFNFLVLGKKKMISDDGADKLRASDKIRMMIKLIDIEVTFQGRQKEVLTNFLKAHSKYNDFPFLFTTVRNSYIHANDKKNKELKELNKEELYAILQTGLYFAELLLLYTLNYKGKYRSRISKNLSQSGVEEYVHWVDSGIDRGEKLF